MTTTAVGAELAFIIRHGAAMLDDVDDAVQRCRTDRYPSRDLAKSCGTLVSGYLALRARLAALPPSVLSDRVDQLLTYAMELTRQASLLAFRPHDSNWDALAAAFCGSKLGAPADELRRLAAGVAEGTAGREFYQPTGRGSQWR